jgi:hypothetical protein
MAEDYGAICESRALRHPRAHEKPPWHPSQSWWRKADREPLNDMNSSRYEQQPPATRSRPQRPTKAAVN